MTHNFWPGLFASKKYRNTSTDGVWPRKWHRIAKALMNAQLFECSWAADDIYFSEKGSPEGSEGTAQGEGRGLILE